MFAGRNRHMHEVVLCRLAELRVGQGRLEEAAVLLAGLGHHEDAVRPLAATYLARGDVELARDLLERSLGGGGLDDVGTGRLLALLVEAHLAAGDAGGRRRGGRAARRDRRGEPGRDRAPGARRRPADGGAWSTGTRRRAGLPARGA